jgi:hypothetical protein
MRVQATRENVNHSIENRESERCVASGCGTNLESRFTHQKAAPNLSEHVPPRKRREASADRGKHSCLSRIIG